MSRSNPEISQNPCKLWLDWSSNDATITHYDKEQKESVKHTLPFTFLWLDQLGKIGGWCDSEESGIYSNEVKNLNDEVLTVRFQKGGTMAQGKYSEIKDQIKAKGARYVASIYLAYKDDKEKLQIGNLSFQGSALASWMEFSKRAGNDIHTKAVVVTGFESGKKGSVEYTYPTFKLIDVSEQTNQEAEQLDRELQQFIKGKPLLIEHPAPSNDKPLEVSDIDDDDLPF